MKEFKYRIEWYGDYGGSLLVWGYNSYHTTCFIVSSTCDLLNVDSDLKQTVTDLVTACVENQSLEDFDAGAIWATEYKFDGCGNMLIGPNYKHFCSPADYILFANILLYTHYCAGLLMAIADPSWDPGCEDIDAKLIDKDGNVIKHEHIDLLFKQDQPKVMFEMLKARINSTNR